MHCHDVLEIQENATRDEIASAFSVKRSKVEASKDVLGLVSYRLKVQELEEAQEECLVWSKRPAVSRLKDRMTQTLDSTSNDVRLNAFCCGPCTFTDICCGNCIETSCCECMCPEMEVSCCYTACGSQAIPIIADLVIYAFGAISILINRKKKQEEAEREEQIHRAEQARSENAQLEAQLRDCRLEQQQLLEQLHEEEILNTEVTAYMEMFSAIGAASLQPISDNQEKRIHAKTDELDKSRKRERELQDKIAYNQRTINADH